MFFYSVKLEQNHVSKSYQINYIPRIFASLHTIIVSPPSLTYCQMFGWICPQCKFKLIESNAIENQELIT